MSDQRITRRRAIGVAGAAGAAIVIGRAGRLGLSAPAAEAAGGICVVDTPEMTEGPYWVDELLKRSDIRAGQDGVRLDLTIRVFDASNGCTPIEGAHVDIWHANASGRYSDEAVQGTQGQTFLRGYQVTDSDGAVTFTTIYPGWYTGRAVHIHVRVRTFNGGTTVLNYTTQIFFSDAQNDAVMTGAAPYSSRSPQTPDTSDETDNILGSSESTNVIALSGSNSAGWSGTFDIALDDGSSESAATITSASVRHTSSGRRVLALVLALTERTTVTARLTHGSTVIASRSATLAKGSKTLHIPIPRSVPAERTRLTVKLAGVSGTTVTRRRTVRIVA